MVKFGSWPGLPGQLLTMAPGSLMPTALPTGAEPGWPGFTDWQDPRGREQRRQRVHLGQEQSKGAGGPAQARPPCPLPSGEEQERVTQPLPEIHVETPFPGN